MMFWVRKGYCDDAGVAKEEHDVVPVAHTHVLARQLPPKNVHYSVFVLQTLDAVGDEYE